MIVEVVAVGTELLLGQIVNSNTATIGAALAERGLDAHFQQTVGDNIGRIAEAIRIGLGRADAVILTGGIGPTQDDLTREAVCLALGREMVFSQEYAARLETWWAKRGRQMPAGNLRQAFHPAGAELLSNPRGTAPGLAIDEGGKLLFCVPGVPSEMEHLLSAEVLPRLVAAAGEDEAIVSRLLRTWGLAESDVAERLDDLYRGSTNPSIAFLATASEIKVRITAKAGSRADAGRMIQPVEDEIRSRLGDVVFGADDETIERVLLRLLSDLGLTIGTAESMTGGLVTARLTDIPGASAVVKGGLVAYQSEVKQRLLGDTPGPEVSEETAVEMAEGVRELLQVEVSVSVTGSAGPQPLEQPPGTVVIAVATPDGTRARRIIFSGDRERVRAYATTAALQLTRLALIGKWW